MVKDKIKNKEETIKNQFEQIRNLLNSNKVVSNKNPNDWTYLAALGTTELKLNEILEFFESVKK